jgi:pilus assembly protein Flp/PilA
MRRFFTDFLSNESGATAIEYSLIAVGIALAIIAAVQAVGTALNANFAKAATGVNP